MEDYNWKKKDKSFTIRLMRFKTSVHVTWRIMIKRRKKKVKYTRTWICARFWLWPSTQGQPLRMWTWGHNNDFFGFGGMTLPDATSALRAALLLFVTLDWASHSSRSRGFHHPSTLVLTSISLILKYLSSFSEF